MDGYYFVIKLPAGVAGNNVPAESPAALAEMFVEACNLVVDHRFVAPDEAPMWKAFYVEDDEERELTPLEDAALIATFEQKTGQRHDWNKG